MLKYLVHTCCILTMFNMLGQETCKKLDMRMQATNSLVCVGLDPDLSKMPVEITQSSQSPENKIYSFLCTIIDITAPHACSFKIQKAFYDELNNGHQLLKDVIAYIHTNHPGIPAFVDCKIGDIDNTMKAYMQNLFENLQADGVVINPYMGDDVLEPFMEDPKKVAIVLIQTSNPSAKVVQELRLEDGQPLWSKMLDLTVNRWNKHKNLIAVLSSNADIRNYEAVRALIPQDMPILLAGIGTQGGNHQVLKQLLNNEGRGVFVNSSRGILYPYTPNDPLWRKSVEQAVIELKDVLNSIRKG